MKKIETISFYFHVFFVTDLCTWSDLGIKIIKMYECNHCLILINYSNKVIYNRG